MDVVKVNCSSMEDICPFRAWEIGRCFRGLLSPEGSSRDIRSSGEDDMTYFLHACGEFLFGKFTRGREPREIFLSDFLTFPLGFSVIGPEAAVTFPEFPKFGVIISIE